MADIDHLDPPAPRATEHWIIPKTVRIEGDGYNPRATKLIDDATGEELKLGVVSMKFSVDVDTPNSLEVVLAGVAMRATCHFVHYEISEEDLHALAKMNGFRIESVPAYPAQMFSYGPAEIQIKFRDFPDLVVTHDSVRRHEAIEAAEAALHQHLKELRDDHYPIPVSTEPDEEGEFLIWAHAPTE